MSIANEGVESLVALGFTALEAEVYIYLLGASPATGYRVSQAIGKPISNTYKAIESLESKGAVIVEHSANRLCRAIPAEELLGQLDRKFRDRRTKAARALAEMPGSTDDDRVYQLRSRDQVYERCRSMLARCQSMAVIDMFPMPMEELRDDIEAAAARGVKIVLTSYRPIELAGVKPVIVRRGEAILELYPGQWITLITDATEQLLALLTLDGNGLHQAVWSGSAYLSWVLHSAVFGEGTMVELVQQIRAGATLEELRTTVEERAGLFSRDVPGFQMLLRRFGSPVCDVGEEDVSAARERLAAGN